MKIYKKSCKKRVLECPMCGCVFEPESQDKAIRIFEYNKTVSIKCPECKELLNAEGINYSVLYDKFGVDIDINATPEKMDNNEFIIQTNKGPIKFTF